MWAFSRKINDTADSGADHRHDSLWANFAREYLMSSMDARNASGMNSASGASSTGKSLPDPALPNPPVSPHDGTPADSGSAYDTHRDGSQAGNPRLDTETCSDGAIVLDNVLSQTTPIPQQGPLRPGSDFGRYHILRVLGQGAMGIVYAAHDTKLDRDVALKIPTLDAQNQQVLVDRFQREARSAANLRHSNICPVHDVGEVDGVPYLTMGLILGHSLADIVLAEGRLKASRACEIIEKLARAIQEAHAQGIIHRDLKPSNVIIDERGEPVVMDFGLARREEADDDRITQSGAVLGTPAYMSPEQVEGAIDQVGAHSDQFSLGVIFYELLSGKRPFIAASLSSVLYKVVHEPPAKLIEQVEGLHPNIEAVCFRAMAKKPADRFASMAAFADAIVEARSLISIADFVPRTIEDLRQQVVEAGVLSDEEFDLVVEPSDGPTDVEKVLDRLQRTEANWSGSWDPNQPLLTHFQLERIRSGMARRLRVDHYVLLDRLGSEGHKTVYSARNVNLSRLEAILACHKGTIGLADAITVNIASLIRLNHPGIPAMYHYGSSAEFDYYAMQFVHGGNIWNEVDGGKKEPKGLPVCTAMQRVAAIAEILEYAHENGIPHGDLKPSTVLVNEDGEVKLANLGIIRRFDPKYHAAEWEQTRHVWGSPYFAAPELWSGAQPTSPASDIYSLGCLLYYMLVGEPPYKGNSFDTLEYQHREAAIPSVLSKRPDIKPAVEAMLRKLLEKDPARRYPSAAAVITAVKKFARPQSMFSPGRVASSIVGVAAASVAVYLFAFRGHDARIPVESQTPSVVAVQPIESSPLPLPIETVPPAPLPPPIETKLPEPKIPEPKATVETKPQPAKPADESAPKVEKAEKAETQVAVVTPKPVAPVEKKRPDPPKMLPGAREAAQAADALSKGDLQGAIAAYRAAMEMAPDNREYAAKLAQLFLHLGETSLSRGGAAYKANDIGKAIMLYEEAAQSLRDAKSIDPTNAEIRMRLAQAYNFIGVMFYNQSNFQEAVKNYSLAIAENPNYPDARRFQGMALSRLGEQDMASKKYADAIKDFIAAVEDNPEDAKSLSTLAFLFAAGPAKELRDGAKAVQYATRLCELTKNSDWSYILILADAHAQAGNFEKATEVANQALSLAPADQKATVQDHLKFISMNQSAP